MLYALVCWGPDALSRFNGMFALAFYDSLEEKLLLARDRAGIKPIYYMHVPSKGLVFASQYDQIISHPWSKQLGISNKALDLYLRLGYIPAPFSILKNTYMLEQGSWQTVGCEHPYRREIQ